MATFLFYEDRHPIFLKFLHYHDSLLLLIVLWTFLVPAQSVGEEEPILPDGSCESLEFTSANGQFCHYTGRSDIFKHYAATGGWYGAKETIPKLFSSIYSFINYYPEKITIQLSKDSLKVTFTIKRSRRFVLPDLDSMANGLKGMTIFIFTHCRSILSWFHPVWTCHYTRTINGSGEPISDQLQSKTNTGQGLEPKIRTSKGTLW